MEWQILLVYVYFAVGFTVMLLFAIYGLILFHFSLNGDLIEHRYKIKLARLETEQQRRIEQLKNDSKVIPLHINRN